MLRKLSNWYSYSKYIIVNNIFKVCISALNILVFITAIASLYIDIVNKQDNNTAFSFIILTFSFISIVLDIVNYISEKDKKIIASRAKIYKGNTNINDAEFMDSHDYKKINIKISDVKQKIYREEAVLFSQDVNNRLLYGEPIKINSDTGSYKNVKRYLSENKKTLMKFLKVKYIECQKDGSIFYNEKKLCLSSELTSGIDTASIHKGGYYDTYLTNIITGYNLHSNEDNSNILASTEKLLPVIYKKTTMQILPISATCFNNEIGISTIGITTDNFLVIFKQNRLALSSQDLYVPTASGSADWNDYKLNKTSLNDAVIYAMNRELWEECGFKKASILKPNTIGDTKIIGYFKWLEKNGKPEFIGVTKINSKLTDINPDKKEVYNKKAFHIDNIIDLKDFIQDFIKKQNISVPLYVGLIFLSNYLEKDICSNCSQTCKAENCKSIFKIFYK